MYKILQPLEGPQLCFERLARSKKVHHVWIVHGLSLETGIVGCWIEER